MAKVELKHLRKRYDKQDVVHDFDATIADGEFVVIVGPSGCGKSTLLRMVAGLEEASGGEICIDGRDVARLEPSARNIAMVFQNYALYPHMNVFDNMAYGLRIRGMPKAEIRRKVEAAAEVLELGAFLDRKPGQLSGGQRQRVAMGRAIVREPSLFLFDEPLSNLDAKLRVQMRVEIQKLHRRLQTTSLYVTHDQLEAVTLAQRMIVMNAGAIEQIGTPAEVYDRPASTFVAGFIGSPPMNLLPGYVTREGAYFQIEGGREMALPVSASALLDRPVWLGIRPEHLNLRPGPLALEVEMVESLGSEQLIHCRAGAAPVVVRAPHASQIPQGGLISTFFRPEHLHWFDAASGRRL